MLTDQPFGRSCGVPLLRRLKRLLLVQCLAMEQPLPAHCALPRNTTGTLNP